MKPDTRSLRRKERIGNLIGLVDKMLEAGEVSRAEIKRVAMVRLGEDPAYTDHILRPLVESGKYVDKEGLLSFSERVVVEKEADEVFSARPVE